MKETHILFVCKYNKFRSRVAEAVFKKLNTSPLFKVQSAGVIPGSFLNSTTVAACKEIGIVLKGKPQGLSIPLLEWQDVMVIVADNVPPRLFDQKKHGK